MIKIILLNSQLRASKFVEIIMQDKSDLHNFRAHCVEYYGTNESGKCALYNAVRSS